MIRHKTPEELEISGGGFLGLAKHHVTFADRDLRKYLSGAGVGDREVGTSIPVLLAPLGVEHIDMPATPERIWRAIQRARQG